VLLQAYGGLVAAHPEYRSRHDALLNELAETQPRNPLILSALGGRAAVSGTAQGFLEAQRELSASIAAGSTEASDFEAYAYALVRLGRLSEAASVLKQGIEINPYFPHLADGRAAWLHGGSRMSGDVHVRF
jgi:uncharacterized protein HemY